LFGRLDGDAIYFQAQSMREKYSQHYN